MNQENLFEGILIAALAVAALSASQTTLAGEDRTRLECRDALALQDGSMQARYERDAERTKFSVEMEVLPGGALIAGDVLQVQVNGQLVGAIALTQGATDLVGGLDFDTTADALDADSPFPVNFPAVGPGSTVQIGTGLGCSLQIR